MRATWALLISSLLLIVTVSGWLIGVRIDAERAAQVATVGDRDQAIAMAASPPRTPASAPAPSITPQSASTPTGIPVPRRVRIPALDVNARIVAVGLDRHDNMEIPEDIDKVGWYDLGVPPGAPTGSAVLVGHRDGVEQGRGAFYSIGSLEPGERIDIERDDGSSVSYRVVSRELIGRPSFATEANDLFAIDGPHRLTLISCGGVYDRDRGGYQSNVIVTALVT